MLLHPRAAGKSGWPWCTPRRFADQGEPAQQDEECSSAERKRCDGAGRRHASFFTFHISGRPFSTPLIVLR